MLQDIKSLLYHFLMCNEELMIEELQNLFAHGGSLGHFLKGLFLTNLSLNYALFMFFKVYVYCYY